MGMYQKIYEYLLWRYLKNTGDYTNPEIQRLKQSRWLHRFGNPDLSWYWFKIEMVKTNRCTVGWKEGQKLFFDNTGMLITRKCPKRICPHAIAAIDPVLYMVLDRIGRGVDPVKISVDHVCCTDPGFDNGGMGNNTMRITFERMPLIDYLRNQMNMQRRILFRSRGARGTDPGGMPE